MSELRFTCPHTPARTAGEGPPCGHRVHGRGRARQECLGHSAVVWLVEVCGGTEHARRTWSFAMGVIFVAMTGSAARAALDGSLFVLAGMSLDALSFGGLALALHREHRGGGKCWLYATPLAGAATVLYGVSTLPAHFTERLGGPADTAWMLDALEAFACAGVGLTLLARWCVFLAYDAGLPGWERRGYIAEQVVRVLVALIAVVMVVMSGGAKSDLLTWLLAGGGTTVVARGVGRIRRLARMAQV